MAIRLGALSIAFTLGISFTLSYFDYKVNLTLLVLIGLVVTAGLVDAGPGLLLVVMLLGATMLGTQLSRHIANTDLYLDM